MKNYKNMENILIIYQDGILVQEPINKENIEYTLTDQAKIKFFNSISEANEFIEKNLKTYEEVLAERK